ncbi:MAG TPA: DUF4349 domain-containing protein [Candidatus Acidoferrales bacterium]|nr:DUF4349 domain-containing protein [Candidatus Acidoferrales bacterium]
MDSTTHPFDREEVMAYLDGELAPERATAAAAHLEQCAECRTLATELRAVARQMGEWPVEALPARVGENVMRAAADQKLAQKFVPQPVPREKKPEANRSKIRWMVWGGALSAAVLFMLVIAIPALRRSSERLGAAREATGLSSPTASGNAPAPLPPAKPAPSAGMLSRDEYRSANELAESKSKKQVDGALTANAMSNTRVAGKDSLAADAKEKSAPGPMIIRRASVAMLTREFDAARAALENLVKAHQGYFGQLDVASPAGAGRSLTATLRVPAAQLDGVLVELRKLGRVQEENQSADDITGQYVDLTARLANARETEKRLVEILRERTGKVTDVLQVEREIARTRQQIEQMDAERKGLDGQVQYAAVDLRITEEYKQSLEAPKPAPSLGTRINNAAVGGFRDAADTVIGLVLWLLGAAPSLALWTLLLGWPVWRTVRWVRRRFLSLRSGVVRAY